MNDQRYGLGKCIAVLVGVFLLASQLQAQQQQTKLTVRYAKAAFLSLLAIESDISTAKDKSSEATEMSATQAQIDAADADATSIDEQSITKTLREIYRLRLQDNALLRAYQKLAEIETAEDTSDDRFTKKRKGEAVYQLGDSEEAIEKRETVCFEHLEESLRQRSPQGTSACSEWIGKAKMSEALSKSPIGD